MKSDLQNSKISLAYDGSNPSMPMTVNRAKGTIECILHYNSPFAMDRIKYGATYDLSLIDTIPNTLDKCSDSDIAVIVDKFNLPSEELFAYRDFLRKLSSEKPNFRTPHIGRTSHVKYF